jgi:hypothetical protein
MRRLAFLYWAGLSATTRQRKIVFRYYMRKYR